MTSNGERRGPGRRRASRVHDLEFSLDYPTREEQDAQRGRQLGSGARCKRALRRLGVPVTIVAVMMRTNFGGSPDRGHRRAVRSAPAGDVCQSVRPSPTYGSTGRRSSCSSPRPTCSRWASRWCGPCSGCARRRRMRGGDGADHAARDGAAVRVLAWTRRPAEAAPRGGRERGRDAGVPRRSLAASGLRALRAARSMRRGMRRPPAARGGARSTRSVLPRRARRTATAANAHRVGPRFAQGRQRLHHDRHGALVDGDELSSAPRPRRFRRQSHRAAPSSAPYSTTSAHPGTAQGTPASCHTT